MDPQIIDRMIGFIRDLYPGENPVPLHAPRFLGNEKRYLTECIDSTYVSYVGHFVAEFEEHIKRVTGAPHAVAMVNGTTALHLALVACGVKPGDLVLTQALTFVATANAIRHAGADPVFVDVDRDTLGMSPLRLAEFLERECVRRPTGLYDRITNRRLAAVVPMHTFGHPVRIEEIRDLCERYRLVLIEDAAESLGSTSGGKHTGCFGQAAILSFNGNKPVTTGGGGMMMTRDADVAERVRHLSTTAKRKHAWEFFHDEVGYNLRLPNVNAAIGCAQMEYFDHILQNKRETAERYAAFCATAGVDFLRERPGCRCNYWLNAIVLADRAERDAFLQATNGQGVQTRPVWVLMNKLPMYAACRRGSLDASEWLEDRVVNIPSSVRGSRSHPSGKDLCS